MIQHRVPIWFRSSYVASGLGVQILKTRTCDDRNLWGKEKYTEGRENRSPRSMQSVRFNMQCRFCPGCWDIAWDSNISGQLNSSWLSSVYWCLKTWIQKQVKLELISHLTITFALELWRVTEKLMISVSLAYGGKRRIKSLLLLPIKTIANTEGLLFNVTQSKLGTWWLASFGGQQLSSKIWVEF